MSQERPPLEEEIDEAEVADLLASLVDRSLAIRDEITGRYRLLETVRQFGRDRLLEQGEIERWRDRHLAWFTALGKDAEPHLAAGGQQEWLECVQAEHDNLRAAMDWGIEYSALSIENAAASLKTQYSNLNSQNSLRLAAAIWRFWYVRGHFTEGRSRLAALLRTDLGCDPPARASALTGAGVMAYCQGDYAASRALFEESLVLRKKLGDHSGVATILNNLGNVAYDQAEYAAARALFEESLVLRRQLGEPRGVAATLNNLGNVLSEQGDYAVARALFEESVAIKEEIGDRWGMASSLSNLGMVSFREADIPAARSRFEVSLAIRREMGDLSGTAISLNNLGNALLAQGDHPGAAALFRESLEIERKLGDRWGIAFSLEGFAAAEAGYGRWRLAARIWGAAERLRSEIGAPIPLNDRPLYEQTVAETRAAAANDRVFDGAWREGRMLPLDQAIDLALG